MKDTDPMGRVLTGVCGLTDCLSSIGRLAPRMRPISCCFTGFRLRLGCSSLFSLAWPTNTT